MEKTIEAISGWTSHQVVDRRSHVHEMEWAEEGVVNYLGDKIITHADEPGRIQAYKKLRRQQLRLVSFEGRPYAIETVQEVWGETDGESNFMIRIYTPEGDNPLKLAEELRRVVEDTIKLKHEALRGRA